MFVASYPDILQNLTPGPTHLFTRNQNQFRFRKYQKVARVVSAVSANAYA